MYLRIALCVVLLGAGPAAWAGDAPPKRIVVFGDSLSDDGNLSRWVGPEFLPPWYFEGRASNGLVWVEQLANDWDASLANYAFNGAQTGYWFKDPPPGLVEFFGFPEEPGIPSINLQITAYLLKERPRKDTLYVIFAGSNDILFGGADNEQSVENLRRHILRLRRRGARHFLIANIPPLGQTPLALFADDTGATAAALEFLASDFTARLEVELEELDQLPRTEIHLLDVDGLVRDIVADPFSYGIFDTTTPAFLVPEESLPPGVTFDNFLFWDDVHPTRAGHALIAAEAKWTVEGD